ncbi:MAG: DNA polymerase III subunit delta' [Deltaproteobacteria bacterium]
MKLQEILGQDRAREQLLLALRRDRLAHALIFSGPGGVGKRTMALALARALFCTTAPGEGCDFCDDCHLIDAGTHPDLQIEDMERAREERATTRQLSIAQMRRLRSGLALRGMRSRRKVAIIEPAEKLTADAQNALLKTLEEPPAACTILLVTTNADALLATIRSRCQRVLFAPLPAATIEELLVRRGTPSDQAAAVAALAGGSLDEADRLASEETRTRREELHDRLDDLHSLPIPDLLDFAAALGRGKGDERRQRMALDSTIFLQWARGRMLEATESGDSETIRRALGRLRRIHGTTRDLERYANAQLSWESLLLDLQGREGL